MAISIVDFELPYNTHNVYDVLFDTHRIDTLVTHTPAMVETWLAESPIHNNPSNPRIVGLDVEWRPNFSRQVDNPIATLQLCVGHHCLIYQLIHTPNIPQALFDYLADRSRTFVGVGIENDAEKLLIDYGLRVGNAVDLGVFAADKLGARELRNAGLKGLAMAVLGKEVQKPKRVTMSRWDTEWLTCAQVQYACVDAFLSFEIARQLNVGA